MICAADEDDMMVWLVRLGAPVRQETGFVVPYFSLIFFLSFILAAAMASLDCRPLGAEVPGVNDRSSPGNVMFLTDRS